MLIRYEETYNELTLVRDEIAKWLDRCKDADANNGGLSTGHNASQIRTLDRVLQGTADTLQDRFEVAAGKTDIDDGTADAICRGYDEALVSLQRVWQFYRFRFDQRIDETDDHRRRFIRAAEEMVWSCWHGAFPDDKYAALRGPTPLVYIDTEFSPAAFKATLVDEDYSPVEAGRTSMSEEASAVNLTDLQRFMRGLPLPAIALPPYYVRAPWWLLLVAHEVGHHVFDRSKSKTAFSILLKDAAPQPLGDKYFFWAEEIFADLFSVVALGPYAGAMLASLLRSPGESMTKSADRRYPPPALRLEIMARAAESLGCPADEANLARNGIQTAVLLAEAGLQAHLDGIEGLVTKALNTEIGPPEDRRPLGRRCLPIPFRHVNRYARTVTLNPDAHLELPLELRGSLKTKPAMARFLACVVWAAWSEQMKQTSESARRESFRRQLMETAYRVMEEASPPGYRGAEEDSEDHSDAAQELMEILTVGLPVV